MDENVELSKGTCQANEDHPGNRIVQRYLNERLEPGEFAEEAMRNLHLVAKPLLADPPRADTCDMQRAEILYHRGRQAKDPPLREADFSEAAGRLDSAIHDWQHAIGQCAWQMGGCESHENFATVTLGLE